MHPVCGARCITSRASPPRLWCEPTLRSDRSHSMRQCVLLLAAPSAFFVASACAPAAPPSANAALPAEQVTLRGTDDFRMDPSTLTVEAGQPLQVTFRNDGEILHDFTAEQGLSKPVPIVDRKS